MQPHTLSALTLTSAMVFGVAAMAADLPKEGTFSGAYTGWGTAKATQIGKERLLVSTDQTGVTLTNGFTDHVVWRCWGTNDAVKGMAQWSGYCRESTQRAISWFTTASVKSTRWSRRPPEGRALSQPALESM
jgi:hypothetical protein